jgi:hypothetical protein
VNADFTTAVDIFGAGVVFAELVRILSVEEKKKKKKTDSNLAYWKTLPV